MKIGWLATISNARLGAVKAIYGIKREALVRKSKSVVEVQARDNLLHRDGSVELEARGHLFGDSTRACVAIE